MLTKLLVTALVISGAWAVLKRSAAQKQISKPTAEVSQSIIRRYMVTVTLGLLLLGSGCFLAWNWYDDNQVLSVTIMSPNDKISSVYQVKKKNISEHEIVTLEGITIRLSNQERVIISATAQ